MRGMVRRACLGSSFAPSAASRAAASCTDKPEYPADSLVVISLSRSDSRRTAKAEIGTWLTVASPAGALNTGAVDAKRTVEWTSF